MKTLTFYEESGCLLRFNCDNGWAIYRHEGEDIWGRVKYLTRLEYDYVPYEKWLQLDKEASGS